jgi:phosphoglycerol transferase MdoB-like AlkP superfamily enzyme
MGYRFDTVISGYMLALPLVILTLAEFGRFLYKGILLAIHIFICTVYSIAFFGCAADIPYFLTYNNRLTLSILNWIDSPGFMVKMVFTEWDYLIFFILFLVITAMFIFVITRIYRKYAREIAGKKANTRFVMIFASLLAMCVLFIGIRGRVAAKSPILIGTAYFSKYDLANQTGLNPIFTFMNSWFESMKGENKSLHLMDDKTAIKLVKDYLQVPKSNYASPIAREVHSDSASPKYNVILVLMESMSASFTRHGGCDKNLTPVLDSIADRGYYFSNFYSAGFHTYNGIFSSLYGFPALLARHTMIGATIPHYTGLPYIMKQNGYKTIYFTTHDDQFDNVGGFTTENYMDSIISQKDYPYSAVVGALGVPDNFMFNFSIGIFNRFNDLKKPFFATMMTGSNHAPYIVPEGIDFTPKHEEVRNGTVEYADWSIGCFLDSAAKQPWFENTVFVFVADHGAFDGADTSVGFPGMPYALNHIPMIIYSPRLSPRVINNVGGQIDISPTICDLLHFSFVNNTMGIDLLKDKRPYMYFSADDKIAVADTSYFYIWYTNNVPDKLYSFADKNTNIISKHRILADSMKQYAFSMLQVTEWMLQNGKTGVVK